MEGKVIKLFQYATLSINYTDDEENEHIKEYKLRLRSKDVVALTKKLGRNPLSAVLSGFEGANRNDVSGVLNSFDLETYVTILHASLQCFHHGISIDDSYDIFDQFIDAGNSQMEFLTVLMDLFQASGLIPDTEDQPDNVQSLTKGVEEKEGKNA